MTQRLSIDSNSTVTIRTTSNVVPIQSNGLPLPQELINKILSYLPFRDVQSVACVSRASYQAVKGSGLVNTLLNFINALYKLLKPSSNSNRPLVLAPGIHPLDIYTPRVFVPQEPEPTPPALLALQEIEKAVTEANLLGFNLSKEKSVNIKTQLTEILKSLSIDVLKNLVAHVQVPEMLEGIFEEVLFSKSWQEFSHHERWSHFESLCEAGQLTRALVAASLMPMVSRGDAYSKLASQAVFRMSNNLDDVGSLDKEIYIAQHVEENRVQEWIVQNVLERLISRAENLLKNGDIERAKESIAIVVEAAEKLASAPLLFPTTGCVISQALCKSSLLLKEISKSKNQKDSQEKSQIIFNRAEQTLERALSCFKRNQVYYDFFLESYQKAFSQFVATAIQFGDIATKARWLQSKSSFTQFRSFKEKGDWKFETKELLKTSNLKRFLEFGMMLNNEERQNSWFHGIFQNLIETNSLDGMVQTVKESSTGTLETLNHLYLFSIGLIKAGFIEQASKVTQMISSQVIDNSTDLYTQAHYLTQISTSLRKYADNRDITSIQLKHEEIERAAVQAIDSLKKISFDELSDFSASSETILDAKKRRAVRHLPEIFDHIFMNVVAIGAIETAKTVVTEALRISRIISSPKIAAHLCHIYTVLIKVGAITEAEGVKEELFRIARMPVNNRVTETAILEDIANILAQSGETGTAAEFANEALEKIELLENLIENTDEFELQEVSSEAFGLYSHETKSSLKTKASAMRANMLSLLEKQTSKPKATTHQITIVPIGEVDTLLQGATGIRGNGPGMSWTLSTPITQWKASEFPFQFKFVKEEAGNVIWEKDGNRLSPSRSSGGEKTEYRLYTDPRF